MALDSVGVKNIPHPNCLTLRPFSLRYNDDPSLWITPFVEPINGLKAAFKIIGFSDKLKSQTLSSVSVQIHELLMILEHWLNDGMVILGPINRTKIWNRIDSRYYKGAAYYIYVLSYDNNYYLVHDPEGCPCLLLSKSTLIEALDIKYFEIGIIQLPNSLTTNSNRDIYQRTLFAGINSCIAGSHHSKGGSNGLYILSKIIASKKLKSSEEGVLHFLIPSLSLSAHYVSEFLLDLPKSVINNICCYDEIISAILLTLTEEINLCAYTLDCLIRRDIKSLPNQFTKLAINRKKTEELFTSITFQNE